MVMVRIKRAMMTNKPTQDSKGDGRISKPKTAKSSGETKSVSAAPSKRYRKLPKTELDVIHALADNFIALVCSEPDCKIATVIPRYEGDVPYAAYMELL